MAELKSLTIGSRKSHLARYQAYLVGKAIKEKFPHLQIQYFFKESLGDINLTDPLWKMPEKGVFTEDFVGDLETNKVDLVVHSWKDLPTQERKSTEIVATLPRADARDLLIVKKTAFKQNQWTLLCSSPRRQRNLKDFFSWALPNPQPEILFESVRGNIPTRLRKLIQGKDQGLILAKAALDRLLGWKEISKELSSEEKKDFHALEEELRERLNECEWMVLPLSKDPPAAAQGALAIEISKNSSLDLRNILSKINCEKTFQEVKEERKILASFGGGCHQALGMWCRFFESGKILSVRGQADSGQSLDQWTYEDPSRPSLYNLSYFPRNMQEDSLTEEAAPLTVAIPAHSDLWITKAKALPEGFKVNNSQVVWAAGISTWRKLASRGYWVHGSAESLGDLLPPKLDALLGRDENFTRLTHLNAVKNSTCLGTYQIVLKKELPDLSSFHSFYWASGTVFLWALEKYPELKNRNHACGLGRTFETLKRNLPSERPPQLYLSFEAWKKAHTP